MKIRLFVLISTFIFLNSPVFADWSGYGSVTSDYDYRGISQSAEDFALQAGLDYSHTSGFYATGWASSLDWGKGNDADIEVDLIAGFSQEFGDSGIAWDVGYIEYLYPGQSSANFGELYAGLGFADFNLKLSYSNDFAGLDESAWYLDGGYAHSWANGWKILAYGGYSFGDAFSSSQGLAFGAPDYWNYAVGLGYTYKQLYIEGKIVGTDLSGQYAVNSGVFSNDTRGLLSITLSMP